MLDSKEGSRASFQGLLVPATVAPAKPSLEGATALSPALHKGFFRCLLVHLDPGATKRGLTKVVRTVQREEHQEEEAGWMGGSCRRDAELRAAPPWASLSA